MRIVSGLVRGTLLLASIAAAVEPAQAALVDGVVGRVTGVYTFTDLGGGDVVFTIEAPLTTCQGGFWLRMSDAGAKQTYAALLAAYHSQTSLRVRGYDDQLWPASTSPHCRVYMLGLLG